MECSCNHCHSHNDKHSGEKNKIFDLELIITIIGIVFFILANTLNLTEQIKVYVYALSYILIGYDIVINSFKSILKKNILDENCLMVIATVGAFLIGEYNEAIAVLLFYKVGEYLQDMAVRRSQKRIESVFDIRPEVANLKKKNQIIQVEPEKVNVGNIIVVKPGERIPLDGVVIKGNANLDVSALTGESLPKEVEIDSKVLSGSINIDGILEIKVERRYKESTVSKIIDVIQNAANKKSQTEKFITKFAKVYTPIVVVIAILIAVIPIIFIGQENVEYIRRALIFLVISCPCALVLSIPIGFFAGIGSASKKGILVKGSNFLDELNNVNTVLFDKTGTLTKGEFSVNTIVSYGNLSREEVLEYTALVESYSNHSIAKSVVEYYTSTVNKKLDKSIIKNYKELAGYGIKANMNDKEIMAGNYKLLDNNNVKYEKVIGSTAIYLVVDKVCQGYITMSDKIKDNSFITINNLRKLGIKNIAMLTGDSKNIAEDVANKLELDNYYAELLPEDKVNILEDLRKENNKIAFVGDGINDAPIIAIADVGISMGSGSDIAIDTSDVVLMASEIDKVADIMVIAKKTRKIIWQNIVFALGVKVLVMLLGVFGLATMWEAVFADIGVTLITLINSLRLMKI